MPHPSEHPTAFDVPTPLLLSRMVRVALEWHCFLPSCFGSSGVCLNSICCLWSLLCWWERIFHKSSDHVKRHLGVGLVDVDSVHFVEGGFDPLSEHQPLPARRDTGVQLPVARGVRLPGARGDDTAERVAERLALRVAAQAHVDTNTDGRRVAYCKEEAHSEVVRVVKPLFTWLVIHVSKQSIGHKK